MRMKALDEDDEDENGDEGGNGDRRRMRQG